MRIVIFIACLFLLCSCSDDNESPVSPTAVYNPTAMDDDDAILNESNSAVLGSYKYFNVGDHGRMAWRIPRKGTSFGRSFIVQFSNGYKIRVPNSARRNSHRNGFTYRPGIGSIKSGTGTSHGGVYIYAPYGNKSTTLTILR